MATPEELERRGWQALSTDPATATTFYQDVLADEVRMLLPGGLLLSDRAQIIDSMGGPPWDSHELRDLDVLQPGPDVAVVSYGVVAERDGQPYSASIASTYVRHGAGWRMVAHQHTPR